MLPSLIGWQCCSHPALFRVLQSSAPYASSVLGQQKLRWLSTGNAAAAPLASSMADPLPAMAEPLPMGLAVDEVYVDHDSAFTTSAPDADHAGHEAPITAVFLHGMLGSSRNWRSFSRKLAQDAAARANRDVRMLLVDLRCHGASSSRYGLHPPHDMAAAANDVAEVVKQHLGGQAPHMLVGLSLGGKVALQLLKQFVEAQEQQQHHQQHMYQEAPLIAPPEDRRPSYSSSVSSGSQPWHQGPPLQGLPQQVWVLDSQPGTVPIDVDAPTSVGKIINLIHEIPTPLDTRQALYKFLTPKGIPLPVAQWLGSSLAPGGRWGSANGNSNVNGQGKLDWVFDIQGAAALYNSYRLSSYWDVVSKPPPGVIIHMVRGELSDRWTPHMLQQLDDAVSQWNELSSEQPEAVGELKTHVLAKAGHWLQADNPEGLLAMMEPWFRDLHQNRLLF